MMRFLLILCLGTISQFVYAQFGDGCEASPAEFTFGVNECCVGFLPCVEQGSHVWDFGDGSISYDASPSHCYTQNGTYTVVHTYNNSPFNVVTKTVVINNCPEEDPPCSPAINDLQPNFVVYSSAYNIGGMKIWTVDGIDLSTSTDQIVAWDWDFILTNSCGLPGVVNDATTQNGFTFFIIDPNCNDFQLRVCLRVFDECGEAKTRCRFQNTPEYRVPSDEHEIKPKDSKQHAIILETEKDWKSLPAEVIEAVKSQIAEFRIYPNPAVSNSTIQVELPQIGLLDPEKVSEASLQVYSVDGKLLDQIQVTDNGQQQVLLNDYPAGLYNISLFVDGMLMGSERFIVK